MVFTSSNRDLKSISEKDRVIGAMLGLACGDALGAPAEFKTQAEVRALYGHLTEMVGNRMWEPGEWTDDTGMTLCIARGILQEPQEPVKVTGKLFLEWSRSAKDVGSTIRAALDGFYGDWAQAAQQTPQAEEGKAAGNGSLMRTLPVALAYSQRDTMLKMSARFSSMTHWDSQAEVCCAIYCLWIGELLRGRELHDSWRTALEQGRIVAEQGQISLDTPGPYPLPPNFWQRLESAPSLRYDQLQPSGYAGYVVECLEAAVWCCLHAQSLEETLILAVNLAGEADTIGAVAGGIAGAYWGHYSIPERWLEKLYRRDHVQQIGRELYELRSDFNQD